MEIKEISVDHYERVIHGIDPNAGLNAFIAVHCTALGPALGGMRMLPYVSEAEALEDVTRLAKAMSYKAAVAGTGQGGGKAVIIGDPSQKSESLLRAMGRLIESLDGAYITAEDMNLTVADLEIVSRETRWVSGLSLESGASGNPSPMTAVGCLIGMQTCARHVFGDPSLEGKTIAIHGVGAVGSILARLCAEENAQVLVADIDPEKARGCAADLGVTAIEDAVDLLRIPCDILSPCARGAVFSENSIPDLNCRIIAGAANNQLATLEDGDRLAQRGILYAPDYVVNAGGVINLSCEFFPGGYREDESRRRTQQIGPNLDMVFRMAEEAESSTAAAADRLAEQRIARSPE